MASGAVLALSSTRRRLDVASVDPAVLTRLDAQARVRSRGYSLVQWVGRTPQRWLDDMAYLMGRMSTDAPLDDLQQDAEVYDAARIQARDADSNPYMVRINEAMGFRPHHRMGDWQLDV